MAEFELEMEDAGCDQGMHARLFQPAEDIGHHFGNVGRRSACVDKSIAVEHADIAAAETARFGNQAVHHGAVRFQQIIDGVWIQFGDEVVGAFGVLDL